MSEGCYHRDVNGLREINMIFPKGMGVRPDTNYQLVFHAALFKDFENFIDDRFVIFAGMPQPTGTDNDNPSFVQHGMAKIERNMMKAAKLRDPQFVRDSFFKSKENDMSKFC